MKKLQRLQSKENTENEMSNDFMGFVYDDELGANEIQGQDSKSKWAVCKNGRSSKMDGLIQRKFVETLQSMAL